MSDAAGSVLAAVRELRPTLERRASEIEQGRRLPLDLVAELRRAGLFRMLVPRAPTAASSSTSPRASSSSPSSPPPTAPPAGRR